MFFFVCEFCEFRDGAGIAFGLLLVFYVNLVACDGAGSVCSHVNGVL